MLSQIIHAILNEIQLTISCLLMWCWVVSSQVLGDRWANICRWTEDRWVLLQDILLKWQRFTEEQVSHVGQLYR